MHYFAKEWPRLILTTGGLGGLEGFACLTILKWDQMDAVDPAMDDGPLRFGMVAVASYDLLGGDVS